MFIADSTIGQHTVETVIAYGNLDQTRVKLDDMNFELNEQNEYVEILEKQADALHEAAKAYDEIIENLEKRFDELLDGKRINKRDITELLNKVTGKQIEALRKKVNDNE